MRKAMVVGCAVGPFLIPNGHFENLEIELGGPEQQIEISEWVKLAEIRSIGGNPFVVSSKQDFRSAECVLDSFTE